jgi:hypothetical protein
MKERRQVPRHKSLLRGRIFFNNHNSSADCLVRDISTHGARLIFADEMAIPEVVDLFVPQRDMTYRAHVIWRHGSEAGIAFAVPQQLAHSVDFDDMAGRVAKLEHEIELLKRALKRLKADTPFSDTEAA